MNNQTEIKAENIIVTSHAQAAAIAVSEIQKADVSARLEKKLTFTEQMITVPGGYGNLLERLREKGKTPIFIRHMFPVMLTTESFEELLGFITETLHSMSMHGGIKSEPFAIQMRRSAKNSESFGKDITERIENALVNEGYVHDHKNPTWIVSIYADGDVAYAGISQAADNISGYNGGMHRFKKDDGLISRAEFKLLEAVADFGIILPAGGEAIDLGAAPGGFCRVLLESGMNVTAVDPAEMDERLFTYEKKEGNGKFSHYKMLAENLVEMGGLRGKYDVMTNDMRMDIMDSAGITNKLSCLLKPGGLVIMTLKLSEGSWLKKTNKALSLLSREYNIRAARQLFNNRSEVTTLLQKPLNTQENL